MEIKVNNFKLRHAPFSLSPTFDKHSEGLQRINFLNIFSIKDQKKIAKKNSGKIEYTEVSNKKIKENLGREKLNLTPLHKGENLVSETLNLTPMHKGIVKRIEPTKKFTNYHISNKEKREKSKKKAETVALAIVKSEKTLDMKENENLLSFKTIKKDSNIKMQKYKNTPENELKILYYFRFHQHSLLINCGQKEKIEEIHNSNAVQPFLQNIKKNAITSDVFSLSCILKTIKKGFEGARNYIP